MTNPTLKQQVALLDMRAAIVKMEFIKFQLENPTVPSEVYESHRLLVGAFQDEIDKLNAARGVALEKEPDKLAKVQRFYEAELLGVIVDHEHDGEWDKAQILRPLAFALDKILKGEA